VDLGIQGREQSIASSKLLDLRASGRCMRKTEDVEPHGNADRERHGGGHHSKRVDGEVERLRMG
jgi:hypothetical protein